MADWHCKAGDTGTALSATLIKPNGAPADLTGATVRFIMRSGAATVIDRVVPAANAQEGAVLVGFQADEVSTPGSYRGEFKVSYPDGKVQTFPSARFISMLILPHS